MLINKIKLLQNRCIRIIFFASLNIPIHCVRKYMRILNIEDQLKCQISSLMWDYDNNDLPEHLSKYFKRTNLVHNYATRGAGKGNLFYSKVNTLSYGIKSFKFQGVKTFEVQGYFPKKSKSRINFTILTGAVTFTYFLCFLFLINGGGGGGGGGWRGRGRMSFVSKKNASLFTSIYGSN